MKNYIIVLLMLFFSKEIQAQKVSIKTVKVKTVYKRCEMGLAIVGGYKRWTESRNSAGIDVRLIYYMSRKCSFKTRLITANVKPSNWVDFWETTYHDYYVYRNSLLSDMAIEFNYSLLGNYRTTKGTLYFGVGSGGQFQRFRYTKQRTDKSNGNLTNIDGTHFLKIYPTLSLSIGITYKVGKGKLFFEYLVTGNIGGLYCPVGEIPGWRGEYPFRGISVGYSLNMKELKKLRGNYIKPRF